MSPLHKALAEYIETTRALGTELRWPAGVLHDFVGFLESQEAEWITTELALRWSTAPRGVQAATWARRLSIVRQFAIWMHATDPRTEVPARRLLPARHRRKPPYIFTDGQISSLMTEASRLRSRSGMRPLTYEILIGLLAATGLRPGEARGLDDEDVDLHDGVLTLRKTTSGEVRFVPIEASVCSALSMYVAQRDEIRVSHDTQAFLVSEQGTRLGAYAVIRTFAKLCQLIGLGASQQGEPSDRRPRLYDIRHTYTTRKLVEWYAAGLDVNKMMPVLSTYLGHSKVHCTYWYIEAVPELLRLATDRVTGHPEGGLDDVD